MLNIKKFWNGVRIVAKSVLGSDTKGELEVLDSDGKLNYHNGSTRSPVVTESHTATIINKTVNADNNTITDLEVDNLKSGVLNTSTTLATASNTQLPSALAVKTYIDDKTAAQNDASEITFTPAGSISATNVQDAVEEVDTDIQNHIGDASDAHDASAISITSIPTLAATEVQGALTELQSDISTVGSDLGAHIVDAVDAHDASAISVVPTGNLSATEVQAALDELQSDVDSRATGAALTAHTGASTGVHGIAGVVVGTTDTQTVTNKTLTAPVINNGSATGVSIVTPSRLDAKKDTKANLITYASTAANGQFAFATDEKKMYQVVDGLLAAVGGGGQSLDAIFQLFADEEITAWATGDNATFLGGGTLAGTFTKVTSGQLNGDASYRYTQAASSLDDYLASATQSVPLRFRGNQSTVVFPYLYDGNNSDIEFIVYDATNSAKITTSSQTLLPATGTNTSIYRVNVLIPSTCTSIRVGYQVKVLNSGKVLQFDDIVMSADTTRYADPSTVTEWQSYTPTYTGFGTVSASQMQWRRVGSDVEIRGRFTSGTSTAAEARMSLPNGYSSAGTTVIPSIQSAGTYFRIVTTVSHGGSVLVEPSVSYVTFGSVSAFGSTSVNALTKTNGDTMLGSGEGASVLVRIPIAGLSASNPQIITASESFSTDTAQLTYAGSATYTLATLADAPVGTFVTYTYAINSNTRTQTTTAPTQTTADMNVNGIRLFTRAYNVASTTGNPAVVAIQIGKGLKGVNLGLYKSSSKVTGGSLDFYAASTTSQIGLLYKDYNESTGILILDSGVTAFTTITSSNFTFSDITNQTDGYFVINASKSPALVGVPQLQQRIATISDVKASGTDGGTATSGSYQTRTLNTLSDPTGIVTSLASNQFTLPAGEYYIEAMTPAYFCENAKSKLLNITDSTDAIIGGTVYIRSTGTGDNAAQVMTYSPIRGNVVINSAKTFEIQMRVGITVATTGFGIAGSFGDNEVYTVVKIQKVK